MKHIFFMAKLNYKTYKTLSRNSCINIIICSILFLLITSVGMSIQTLHSNYNYKNHSLREIIVTTSEYEKLSENDLMNLSLISNIEDFHVLYSLYPNHYMTIKIDDNELRSLYTFGAHQSYSIFSKKTILEKNNGKYIEPIIFGRSFNALDNKKAIIDENYAYILGYDNPQNIVGKHIAITIEDVVFNHIEIVGVHDYSLGREGLPNLRNADNRDKENYLHTEYNLSPVILSHDIIEYFKVKGLNIKSERTGQLSVSIFADSAENVAQICDQIIKITNRQIASEIYEIEQITKAVNDLKIFIFTFALTIFIVSITSIINVLIIKIDKQKNLTNMMEKMGYKKRDIILIYLLENILILIKAMLITAAIVFIWTLLLDSILAQFYSTFSTIHRFLFIINPLLIITYFLTLTVFISLICFIAIKKQFKNLGINYE